MAARRGPVRAGSTHSPYTCRLSTACHGSLVRYRSNAHYIRAHSRLLMLQFPPLYIIRHVRYNTKVLGIFQTNNRLSPILHLTFNYLRIKAIFRPISLNPACNTIVNAERRSKLSSRSFVGDTRFCRFYAILCLS